MVTAFGDDYDVVVTGQPESPRLFLTVTWGLAKDADAAVRIRVPDHPGNPKQTPAPFEVRKAVFLGVALLNQVPETKVLGTAFRYPATTHRQTTNGQPAPDKGPLIDFMKNLQVDAPTLGCIRPFGIRQFNELGQIVHSEISWACQ